MRLSCLLGLHRPSLASIARRKDGFVAICESCARPLERSHAGKWTASEPLDVVRDRAA